MFAATQGILNQYTNHDYHYTMSLLWNIYSAEKQIRNGHLKRTIYGMTGRDLPLVPSAKGGDKEKDKDGEARGNGKTLRSSTPSSDRRGGCKLSDIFGAEDVIGDTNQKVLNAWLIDMQSLPLLILV